MKSRQAYTDDSEGRWYATRRVDGVEIRDDPLSEGDPLVGVPCAFCRFPFGAGDVIKLVSGLPASEEDERKLGLANDALPAWPFHLDCGNPKMSGDGNTRLMTSLRRRLSVGFLVGSVLCIGARVAGDRSVAAARVKRHSG